jgi:2-methylisocitrate lyase-like PEP mutase family enzyme
MTDRAAFADLVRTGEPILAPVALDPLSARLVESLGFRAAYLSGGGFGFQLSVSEALLTITEVANLTRQITARSNIPLIVDGGVGFGDPPIPGVPSARSRPPAQRPLRSRTRSRPSEPITTRGLSTWFRSR